ncbi:hypothetical protein STEG23_004565, partial [Scotinomys teguina]
VLTKFSSPSLAIAMIPNYDITVHYCEVKMEYNGASQFLTPRKLSLPTTLYADKWNRIEDPDINPYRYENLTFDKDAKTDKWKKEDYDITVHYCDAKVEYNDVTVRYIVVTMPYNDITVPYTDVIMQYYHIIEQRYEITMQYSNAIVQPCDVSTIMQKDGSCFRIHSVNLCLFIVF